MRLSAELETQPGGWGRCGEIQRLSRPFGILGNIGIMGYWDIGLPCGYLSGDLLLTCQVPQGNLGTMMRILSNSAGAMCAYPSLGRSESATWRVCCTARRFGELSRVVPPTHRDCKPGLALAGTGLSRSPGCLCSSDEQQFKSGSRHPALSDLKFPHRTSGGPTNW